MLDDAQDKIESKSNFNISSKGCSNWQPLEAKAKDINEQHGKHEKWDGGEYQGKWEQISENPGCSPPTQ